MAPKQISNWEKSQRKGKFFYILQQTIIFTPLFLLGLAVGFYLFDVSAFGLGTVVEWLVIGFFSSLGCCAIGWYQQQNLYKKSLEKI